MSSHGVMCVRHMSDDKVSEKESSNMKNACTLLLIAASLTLSTFGQARNSTPMSGRAWYASEAGCFSSSWNRLTNNGSCGTAPRKWLFDAPIDTHDNYHVFGFYGRGSNTGLGTTCYAVANSPDGASGYIVSRSTVSYWGHMGPISPQASVWVPSSGTLHADCDLRDGGGVSLFYYAP